MEYNDWINTSDEEAFSRPLTERPMRSRSRSRRVLAIAMAGLGWWMWTSSLAQADSITWKSTGRVTIGQISFWDDTLIRLNTGSANVSVPRVEIKRLEIDGRAIDFVLFNVERAHKEIQTLIQKGQAVQALAQIRLALSDLQKGLEGFKRPPPILIDIRNRIMEDRRLCLSKNDNAQKAEDLYQQAISHLDYVQYDKAFPLLIEAAALDPTRADIARTLATVAHDHMHDTPTAIRAYRALLKLDPQYYYAEAAGPLLELSGTEASRLIKEGKSKDAIEFIQDVLILKADKGTAPVALQEFLGRQARRDRMSELDRLQEVYNYADANDLVDLALVTVDAMQAQKPDDPVLKKLVQELSFYKDFRLSIASGKLDEAARLKSELPDELRNDQRVMQRIALIAGEHADEIDARSLLKAAQTAFDRNAYETADSFVKELLKHYPKTDAAKEAARLATVLGLELPIARELAQIDRALDEGRFEEADKILASLLAKPDVKQSHQYEALSLLRDQMPKEREAGKLWKLAKQHLARRQFEEASAVLDRLVKNYPNTRLGARAQKWLAQYRKDLQHEADMNRQVETGLLCGLSDPTLWRSAGDLFQFNMPVRDGKNEQRPLAWKVFDAVMDRDSKLFADPRWKSLHLVLPLALGSLILLAAVWKWARPGRGKLDEENPMPILGKLATQIKDPDDNRPVTCHLCGQTVIPQQGRTCPACGQDLMPTALELKREQILTRQANWDPWAKNVDQEDENRFAEHFAHAKELIRQRHMHQALTECQLAVQEDPDQPDGYQLMADILEFLGDRRKAAFCYREVLLLHPEARVERLKLESIFDHLRVEKLRLDTVILTLSIAFWWLAVWIALGLYREGWLWIIPLCVVGMVGTIYFWTRQQNRHTSTIEPILRESEKHPIPIPDQPLHWSDANRQARRLALQISEHTGIEVPALTSWRLLATVGCCLTLLAALTTLGWLNHFPWILAGWPAGCVLMIYLLEIHPRALSAFALLRHAYEETHSAWMDPHIPFQPAPTPHAVNGEFLIMRPEEFPLRWAFRPFPYAFTRQGFLNALQQTLNRHLMCHRFYKNMQVLDDFKMPIPIGFRRALGFTLGVIAAALLGSLIYFGSHVRLDSDYKAAMAEGYRRLIAEDTGGAVNQFTQASHLKSERIAPYLYLAHAYSNDNKSVAKEYYRKAVQRAKDFPHVYNDYANFLQRDGQLEEAVRNYQLALQADPKNADILNNLGAACYKLGRYEEAQQYLHEAVNAQPNHKHAYTTLGLVYEALHKKDEARQAYQTATQVAPEHPYTRIAQTRLKEDLVTVNLNPDDSAS